MAVESNLNVNITVPSPVTKTPVSAVDVLMDGGTSQQTASLSAYLLDPPGGRAIPRLGFCPGSRADALRLYRDDLGAAVQAAQTAFSAAVQPLADATEALGDVKALLDQMLATNPDGTTPRSVDELTDAIGGLRPTADRNDLEQRVGELLDLNIVNGVLYPKGTSNLGPLRQLAASLALSATNCDLSRMGAAAGTADGADTGAGADGTLAGGAAAGRADETEAVVGSGDGFLLVTTGSQTVERVVGSTCGDDIIEFDVQVVPLGVNVNIDDAAEAAGEDPASVGVQMFWLDTIRTDPATLQRLKALGLTPEELGAAVTGGSAGRLNSAVVDTTIVAALRAKLTDAEICELLSRPDTRTGINATPTADQVIGAIRNAINQNTGTNQNRAGTDEDAIESGAAGRGGDPVLLLFGLLNLLRSLNFNFSIDPFNIRLDGTDIVSDDLSDDCATILNIIISSLAALQGLLAQAQEFVRTLFVNLGLGNHQLNAGLDFASCLVSFSLGLNVNLQLSIQIPFSIDLFLASFAAMLTAVIAAVTALRGVICKPQGIISLLYGGVCGFKPYDFGGCPPDIAELVDRFLNILNTILSLIGKLTGSLLTMKSDITATKALSASLKTFSPCAAAAAAIGIALGLGEISQLLPEATPTLAVSGPT